MHPLYEYIAKQLAEKLKSRKVLVWYDPRGEFQPFVAELRGGPSMGPELVSVSVAGIATQLTAYAGSMFELRVMAEPHVCGDSPEYVLIYLPGCERDRHASVLMELEKAGECYEPQLKRLGRNILRQRYMDGTIDEILSPERVSYEDLVRALSDTASAEPPSILRGMFHDAAGGVGLLACWLATEARDVEISAKEATRELVKLVRSCIGLELPEKSSLAKLRGVTLRYVLGGEFRSDLHCAPPACLEAIPSPGTKDEESALRELARRLRASFPDAYAVLADRVEQELGLRSAELPAGRLGAIDTFRFEERALLGHCGELIAQEKYDAALAIVGERENSFWLYRDVERKAQWEASRRMAELGSLASVVRAAAAGVSGDANAWVEAYVAKDGWYRLDHAQRRLEAWVANLDEEPAERPLGVVRRGYEDACHALAHGFTKALAKAGWSLTESLHQTHVFSEMVADRPKPVAYFLVDAMRFEMGIELAGGLPPTAEVSVRHAICALPSITPIGMAALQPGASSSFNVEARGGKFGARIDDAFLPDLSARKKLAAARIPKLVDVSLDELLGLPRSKLERKIEGAHIIVVRSQEIDHAGEAGFSFQARQVMGTVIDNITRAIRKLATAGIEHLVVSADHGHLFASDRDESMRMDAPGGDTVELHRRCWIGHGGATPSGCVRVAASALGYASDLDFVFPVGSGVFKAGGDLAFHHGGPSLQELVIPVVSVRWKVRPSNAPKSAPLQVSGLPTEITVRMIVITVAGTVDSDIVPMLVEHGRKIGGLYGVVGTTEYDKDTGVVRLRGGTTTTIALLLSDDTAKLCRVVLTDPATDVELYRSPKDISIRLGV
jgi:hypothetical protein